MLHDGPGGPQDGPRGPQDCSKRGPERGTQTHKSSLPPQEAPGGPRGPQEGRIGSREAAKRPEGAPRGCQGAAQESPKSQKALIFVRFSMGFRVLAFSASRRSKSGQEAPKTGPRRPKRPPSEPQDGLIASEDGVRGAHDGSRAPEDGPKEAQEGGRKPKIKTFRPKRPTGGPKRPARGSKRPPNCPHRGPKRRPDRPEQGLKMLQTCFEETPRCVPIYRGTVHKSCPSTFTPTGMGVHILVQHTSLVGPRACQFLNSCSHDLWVLTYVKL